jgi:hypothetical protein
MQATVGALSVQLVNTPADTWNSPWRFITLTRAGISFEPTSALLSKVMRQANRTAASRVTMVLPQQHGLLIGLLNQLRFWSQSRARLCGLHIVRQHLGAFRPK